MTTSAKNNGWKGGEFCGKALVGTGVSAGIVIGRALVWHDPFSNPSRIDLGADAIEDEVHRFSVAIQQSVAQIHELKERVAEALGSRNAAVFDAHVMLVGDQAMLEEVEATIRREQCNAEFAFHTVLNRYQDALRDLKDGYIRDRLADIRDVAARVINNLTGQCGLSLAHLPDPRVVIAHDLTPSETADIDRQNVIGFATEIGSRTSHTAIMARSLSIPAVVGAPQLTNTVYNDEMVILDGYRGLLIPSPTEETLADYRARIESQQRWFSNIQAEANLPPETPDGFRVRLAANIEQSDEIEQAKEQYGVGIGLYRTEYLFLNRPALPNEEEQLAAYRQAAEAILPRSVIFRTLDIGGDKFLSNLKLPNELNPFLGNRAIRFCLERPEIFRTQIRAILRASAFGKVRLMFPMITTVEEIRQAQNHVQDAKDQLRREKVAFNPYLDVGIMIETPAAAMLADKLAEHVDFFSIGTNDLIQYCMAADRSNPDVGWLYQPCHPALIRLIKQVLAAACRHGRWVSVCGEMAADPVTLPLLLGLGVQELSMSPMALPGVKRLIRRLRMHQAETVVDQALACSTAEEVEKLCRNLIRQVDPQSISIS
ncbi:MAG: phosphoenolpyruvate--protein phosphotransferase [Verrucomicrobiota bacterium]